MKKSKLIAIEIAIEILKLSYNKSQFLNFIDLIKKKNTFDNFLSISNQKIFRTHHSVSFLLSKAERNHLQAAVHEIPTSGPRNSKPDVINNNMCHSFMYTIYIPMHTHTRNHNSYNYIE